MDWDFDPINFYHMYKISKAMVSIVRDGWVDGNIWTYLGNHMMFVENVMVMVI
jgi:hypothetical protein